MVVLRILGLMQLNPLWGPPALLAPYTLRCRNRQEKCEGLKLIRNGSLPNLLGLVYRH